MVSGSPIGKTTKGRSATLIVAASNASARSKRGADYVCDGTDDHVQIQAAIDAVNTLGGGMVYLTEGTFVVGHAANEYSTWYHSIKMKSNVTLMGYGATIQIQATPAHDFMLIYGPTATDANVIGVTLDGLSSNKGQAATFFNGAFRRARIQNCHIKNFYNYGIWWDNSGVSDGMILNNFLENVRAKSISIHNAPKKCVISGNLIVDTNATNQGILLDTASEVTVTGNVVNTTGVGLYMYDSVLDCVFTGNQFTGTADSVAIVHDGAKPDCTGNLFVGNQLKGPLYAQCSANVFRANNITGAVTNTTNIFKDNIGYITENKGTATVAAEGTYVDVAHGLSITPLAQDIVPIPTNAVAAAADWHLSDVGATTFRINAPAGATFAWQIN